MSNPFEEGFRDDAAFLGALGGLAHLRNQSRAQARLAESAEELRKQNSLIEEQNKVLEAQQSTNKSLEEIAKARLLIEQNRAKLEQLEKESREIMNKRVKAARQTMTAINQELDLLDRSFP